VIAQAGTWLVLAALAVQGVVMALSALSSGYDDYSVLRVSGAMGLLVATVLVVRHVHLVPALGIAAAGPMVAFLVSLSHSRARQAFSRGPYADLMASRGCHSFENGRGSERGRKDGRSLSKILCGERFRHDDPDSTERSGEYIGSTILLDGRLHDVNLQAIIGWMPRDPWVAVLTKEEINAIRFAMRPSPPVEELLAEKSRGEFLIHDSFGEGNLRSYLVAHNPDLLLDPALLADAAHNPLQERIEKSQRTRAMQWALTVVVGSALPLVFAWAALAGNIFGGG
jgi:hypothetical protein